MTPPLLAQQLMTNCSWYRLPVLISQRAAACYCKTEHQPEFVPHRTQAFLSAFHLHLRHTQLPKHIDTAPYPAPAGTISSTS